MMLAGIVLDEVSVAVSRRGPTGSSCGTPFLFPPGIQRPRPIEVEVEPGEEEVTPVTVPLPGREPR